MRHDQDHAARPADLADACRRRGIIIVPAHYASTIPGNADARSSPVACPHHDDRADIAAAHRILQQEMPHV